MKIETDEEIEAVLKDRTKWDLVRDDEKYGFRIWRQVFFCGTIFVEEHLHKEGWRFHKFFIMEQGNRKPFRDCGADVLQMDEWIRQKAREGVL